MEKQKQYIEKLPCRLLHIGINVIILVSVYIVYSIIKARTSGSINEFFECVEMTENLLASLTILLGITVLIEWERKKEER